MMLQPQTVIATFDDNFFRQSKSREPWVKTYIDCQNLPHPIYLIDVGIDIGYAIAKGLDQSSVAVLTNLDPFPFTLV